MNGELYQACALVAAVRQALRAGSFSYEGADYEKSLHFTFQNGAQADSARHYLTDPCAALPDWMHIHLPEKNKALFAAASRAWVFGGMGSWNDSPPYLAHEQGLDGDYERLSAALHRQIMLAVLYAVNEW